MYTGQDQQGFNIINNDLVIDNMDFFPSVNFIYAIKPNQNIRLSGTQTLACPSFIEMNMRIFIIL